MSLTEVINNDSTKDIVAKHQGTKQLDHVWCKPTAYVQTHSFSDWFHFRKYFSTIL